MVFNYCDETVVLSHGKIVYHGSTLDLFADDDKLKLDSNYVIVPHKVVERESTK